MNEEPNETDAEQHRDGESGSPTNAEERRDHEAPRKQTGSPAPDDDAEEFDRHNQAVADPDAPWQAYERLVKTLEAHRPGRKTGWCEQCSAGWPCRTAARHIDTVITMCPHGHLMAADLVTELSALKDQIPILCLDIVNGIVTPSRQAEFGAQLIALGVHIQADASKTRR